MIALPDSPKPMTSTTEDKYKGAKINMKKSILATGFTLLYFMLPLGASAQDLKFSKMYVFGDSLSDTGNVSNVTATAQLFDPTIPINPPSPPYYQGRYSNGPVWMDYLADDLGLTLTPSTELAVPSPITVTPISELGVNFNFGGATTTGSVNFAFGGAQTGLGNAGDPRLPGVLREIQSFTDDLQIANQSADPNALYIVWAAGSNDYSSGDFLEPSVPVQNLLTGLTSLATAGAKTIVVPNAPDLGKTARAITLGPEVSNRLTALAEAHNSALARTLDDLSEEFSDVNIIPFDVNSIFNDALENPEDFGFTNVTEACLSVVECATNPDNQDNFLFWDDIHPTTATHAQLGEFAFEALKAAQGPQPVPEPASEASVVLGLAWLLWWRFKGVRQT